MTENSSRYLMIAELAEKYGLTTRALRFYEGLGLLKPERRGRVRYFSPEQEAILRVILYANRLGLPFPEIARRMDRVNNSVTITIEDLDAAGDRLTGELYETEGRISAIVEEICRMREAGVTSRPIIADGL